ncbi:MAG: AAA family ATPase [Candidatus Hadarchaeales archaeon]
MALLKEIILENFMSYKYARIPLRPGLNIICGPNGAGKSSILLGLAVALGQSYTERSRRLGELVRRGESIGRVTVVFDNSPRNGSRPLPDFKSDQIVLSRYLRRDGTYWQELNNRSVLKGEVERLLQRLHLNPDNMLIIMHQNMIDLFGALDPPQRLQLVEEAVGMKNYREMILQAREKLSHTLSEEQAIKSMLERAQETLKHWEAEYQRLLRKRELQESKRRLELEHAWAKYQRREEEAAELKRKISDLKRELAEILQGLEAGTREEADLKEELGRLEFELDSAYQALILLERRRAEAETRAKLLEGLKLQGVERELERAKATLPEVDGEIEEKRSEVSRVKQLLSKRREEYVNCRVRLAVLEFRKGLVEGEVSTLQSDLRRVQEELAELRVEAEKVGPRVKTSRKPAEVLDELRLVNAQLASLADVSEDAEKMYMSYQETLKELEEKSRIAAKNRERALQELELRKRRWQTELEKLLKEVRVSFNRLLERVGGRGDLVLSHPEDIEESGLEIYVGFGGAEPHLLDAYTQSGGERTTAIMCFMLALQNRIKSPLRAVDEFEAHLDPHKREELMRGIMEVCGEGENQYLLITPGWLSGLQKVSNVVVVQNVGGVSEVKIVEAD